MTDEDHPGEGPCLAHLLVDGHAVDAATWRDVARYRRAERLRLLAARAMPVAARKVETERLTAALSDLVPFEPGTTLAVYWPIRGEPDLRDWMTAAAAAGVQVLLPVVLERNAPLGFRKWSPQCRMMRGHWNIPVPADGALEQPGTVVAPLVGVDEGLFRLGNGGGYYDRTLARLAPRPRVIGVGFAGCAIGTIFPMPWDIPMDAVVLSDGSVRHRGEGRP